MLPLPTRILIAMSSFLTSYGLWLVLVLLLLWLWMKRSGRKPSLPFMRGVRERLTLALVTSHLSTLLRSGIPLVQALRMTSSMDAHSQRWLDVAELVKAGHRYRDQIRRQPRPWRI